jgi:two-component SAPR family response regulator
MEVQNKKLKTLLVDADVHALRELTRVILNSPRLELVNTCKTGRAAVNVLKEFPVDLVIMNPALPDANGFDLIASMPKPPLVIIISDREDYAFFAYRIDAVDYRLKPLAGQRMDESIDRVFLRLMMQQALADRQKKE